VGFVVDEMVLEQGFIRVFFLVLQADHYSAIARYSSITANMVTIGTSDTFI
jgi:hypothetical protein